MTSGRLELKANCEAEGFEWHQEAMGTRGCGGQP